MSNGSRPDALVRQFEDLFTAGAVGGLSDGELLERFLQDRSTAGEAAFRALVERHGPMVLRVCNQTLTDRHAAEDAFQATFLVLARQACSIRKRASMTCWLFGVARRAAARIQVAEARRRRYERQSTPRLAVLTSQPESSESWPELHAEVERLPEKYRVPIILCYFEGLTHEQAASQLRWPVGTVKTRLSRAREQLRSRLERRGWTSVKMALASRPLPDGATAIPRSLLSATSEMATRFTAGTAGGGFASSAVLTITSGVLRAMWINKLRLAGVVLFGVVGLGLGAAVVAQQAGGKEQAGVVEPSETPRAVPPTPAGLRFPGVTGLDQEKLVRIRPRFGGRVDKVLVSVGARVKKGDPLVELFSKDLAAAKNDYLAALAYPGGANRKARTDSAKFELLDLGLTEKEIADVPNEADVQKAQWVLHSPVDGLIIERSASPGEVVQPRHTLLAIGQDDPLWVNASISGWDYARLVTGRNATVDFPSDPRTLTVRIEPVNPQLDRDTAMVKFRIPIPNTDHRLRPGMIVHVQQDSQTAPAESRKPHRPVEPRPNPDVMERLDEVERKIDKLLKEKAQSPSDSGILERLDQIEAQAKPASRRREG